MREFGKLVKVYLDTQDYLKLIDPPQGSELEEVKAKLLKAKASREADFYFSWLIVLELIKPAASAFNDDRRARGQILFEFCEKNALPSFSDLRVTPKDRPAGVWTPYSTYYALSPRALDKFIYKKVEEYLERNGYSRSIRRKYSSKKGLRELMRDVGPQAFGPQMFKDYITPNRKEFDVLLPRFFAGSATAKEVSDLVRSWMSDPREIFDILYRDSDREDLLIAHFAPSWSKIRDAVAEYIDMAASLRRLREERADLVASLKAQGLDRRKIRELLPEPIPDLPDMTPDPRLDKLLGQGRAHHFSHYVNCVAKGSILPKDSDIADIYHLVYLPDCDLFRCDKAMYSIFSTLDGFKGKLVERLEDLPDRIEEFRSGRET